MRSGRAEYKIVSRQRLRDLLAEPRRRGREIVLANGCFDTLHVGQIRYLEGARREGDILAVAVNSDSSVCALKGDGRPILPETARAALVGGLRAVDYVLLFSEQNVERSEEHTSELQSHLNLVCRLLLEKKKTRLICLPRPPPHPLPSPLHPPPPLSPPFL